MNCNTRALSHSGMPTLGVLRPIDGSDEPMQPAPPAKVPEFVLYVHPDCPKSIELVQLLNKCPLSQLLIQNVCNIDPRPAWLNGVPMLANTKVGLVYKGSDAIIVVNRLIDLHIKSTKLPPQTNSRQLSQQRPESLNGSEKIGPSRDLHEEMTRRQMNNKQSSLNDKKMDMTSPFDEDNNNNLFQAGSSLGASVISLPDNSHRYEADQAGSENMKEYQNRRNGQSQQ
jgi:hypothetical protein